MKFKAFLKGASMIGIFPRKRQALKPVTFVATQSDETAMQDDFLQVGNDLKVAMERYGRKQQLTQH
ncbi:hypothetical protein [Vreelandella aquamarina]|uniref:hypothetical protein n=1 Tax=Vreelandella aquamarina TaxID=77097 RepID=UPI00384B707C